MLRQHNIHRRNHSVSDFVWNNDLADYAKTLALTCVFAHDGTIGSADYGQNLAALNGVDDPVTAGARMVTNVWYNSELPYYLWYGGNPPLDSNPDLWDHFTQMVWKDSSEVGCSTVACPAGTIFENTDCWYSVCNYRPPGNYLGEFDENVFPPLGHPTVHIGD
ncbi:hypothetical protein RJ55_04340 [Drechmeria coniospora]|nr:hypothetical protein RJ55_04340 [Drechmeria coniospora]